MSASPLPWRRCTSPTSIAPPRSCCGRGAGGSASRAAAGALRLGRTVGAALTEQRVLEPAEARLLALVGAALIGVAAAASFWPLLIAAPLCVILVWIALALLARAYSLRRTRRARGQPKMRVVRR